MKFRTEITPAPVEPKIDHTRRGLAVGSCFATTIASRLARYKFPVTINPTGVLYNPFSIAEMLETAPAADYLIITFGTAWVYELNGRVVANCEKRPASLFTRRRLGVEEIVERFDRLLRGPLAGRQIVLTLSPIRHLKDGFEENSLSKATLRLAIAGIVARHPAQTHYFPAAEILLDDLRDYRFYAPDLTHPSTEAVDYIWEKFAAAALSERAKKLIPEIEKIIKATEHRPFGPATAEHEEFRHTMLERTKALAARHPAIDLSAEIDFFC